MSWFTPETDPKLFRCGCGRPACPAPPPSADLLAHLELLRWRLERAIIVTSGPRCPEYNASVKGTANSDHLTGDGADLAAPDAHTRYDLLQANFRGQPIFRRLGIGRDFLHVGVVGATPHALSVCWTYYGTP